MNVNGSAAEGGSSTAVVAGVRDLQYQDSRKSLSPEMAAALCAPLPAEAIKEHPSKSYLSSIKTIFVVERLNQVFGVGGWTYKTEIIENDPTHAMVVMRVVLQVPAYGIELEQYGGSDNEDRGDAYKGAVTDALGKVAGYLGIAMDVYKGFGPTKGNGGKRQTAPQERPPAQRREPKPADAQQAVAEQKIATGGALEFPWSTLGEMQRAHNLLRDHKNVGELIYLDTLARYSYANQEELCAAIKRKHPNAREHAFAIWQYLDVLSRVPNAKGKVA